MPSSFPGKDPIPSPFLGMDPYLENPGMWPDVHHSLISEYQASLVAQLKPRYYASVEVQVYFEQGAEIKEAFLKVVHREAHEVVTIIEILRPLTKVPGSPSHLGFEATKREDRHRPLHRVEIDLLRGDRMVPLPIDIGPHEYLVSILGNTDVRNDRYGRSACFSLSRS